MTIGITGPIDLNILDCDFGNAKLPETNAFPLPSHLANALLRRGHKLVLYTNSGSIAAPVVLKSENVTACIGTTKPQAGRRFFQHEIKELAGLMRAHPADVVYAFWSYEYAWAALKSGLPAIVSVHDIAGKIFRTQTDMFRFVRLMMNYIVLKKADHLVANSVYTYKQLSGKQKSKTQVIDNFFAPDIEQSVVRPAEKENYIISVVNGFTKRKGIYQGLHAFARIRARFPTLEYHLIGIEMEENGAAHNYARAHQLEQGVRFLGHLTHDKLLQRVANARLLLHPSVEESFGMSLLESMVVGTPVVAGKDSGFVPYLLDHGKAGLLCDVHSPEDIAAKALQLLSDKTLADATATYAYRFAQDNFSEEAIVRKHVALYEAVAFHNKTRNVKSEALQAGPV